MRTLTRIFLSLCLCLAAAACDERENDNAGCDDGRDLEAVVVAIEAAPEGACDAPMIVRADMLDPDTGETVYTDVELYDGVVLPQAWLDEQQIEIGTRLDVYEHICQGGVIDVTSHPSPPSC